MLRWTPVALAFLLGACDSGRDDAAGEIESGRATAEGALDTAGAELDAAVDGPDADAADDTDAANTGARNANAGDAAMGGPEGGARAGPVSAATGSDDRSGTERADARTNLNLSRDQVRQLQTALNDIDCSAGPVDGIVGRQTREAIRCGMERNNIAEGDMDGLYRSLNLEFES